MSEEPLQEQEPGDLLKERSDFPEQNTTESNLNEAGSKSIEPSTSTSETVEDLTAPEQTNDQELHLQSMSVTYPETESKDVHHTVESVSLASEESIKQSKQFLPGKKGDAPFNYDFFGDSISSAPVDALVIQVNTEESAQRSNELLDEGVRGLCDGVILNLNQELATDSPNLFDLVNITSDAFVSSLSDTALPEVALTDTFSLLDNHPILPQNDLILGLTDQLIVPASAPVNQEEDQSHFTTNSQREDQEADFDIFGSNNALFTQPPTVNVPHQGGADSSSNQPTAFPDDIFGSSDVLTVLPSTPATSNSLYDWFGSDSASVAPPSAPTGLFADDIFTSEPKLLAVSEPSDVKLYVDSLLVSDNSSTEQTAESIVTNSNWMDDLLG
ncbi:uncharacterized protein [Pseudochaenichthys georgianus]|uniref:uncharacterized protein isoform X2 n=1 Tax=Pseudochaenichthys georgianus TaxID=52239 RepID=UPI00146CF6BF|nr:uncharacterized protein LOC117461877 isoform X2 [Pseudochaenichthys georgianus]